MTVLIFVLIFIGVMNIAMSGGALRIILPHLADLAGYTLVDGELAYDSTNNVMKLRADGENKEILTEDFRFVLHSLTDLNGETLQNGQLIYDDTNKELLLRRDEANVNMQREMQICYLKDVRPSGTVGGAATAGAWYVRVLNTSEGDCSFVTLSSNQFTLSPGKYDIYANAPFYAVYGRKIVIYNVTDSTFDIIGDSNWAYKLTNSANNATLVGVLNITSSKTYELRYKVSDAGHGTESLGMSLSMGVNEVFSQVKITKIK